MDNLINKLADAIIHRLPSEYDECSFRDALNAAAAALEVLDAAKERKKK